jgi:hypothetical protein
MGAAAAGLALCWPHNMETDKTKARVVIRYRKTDSCRGKSKRSVRPAHRQTDLGSLARLIRLLQSQPARCLPVAPLLAPCGKRPNKQ